MEGLRSRTRVRRRMMNTLEGVEAGTTAISGGGSEEDLLALVPGSHGKSVLLSPGEEGRVKGYLGFLSCDDYVGAFIT